MCIGIPMQVIAVRPGFVRAVGRGEQREVCTALVAPVMVGDWLLVFLDSARERIDAARAGEIDATLDLVEHVLAGTGAAGGADGDAFVLPSSLSPAALARLTGST